MTTTTGNSTVLPVGTWQLDAAHSQVGFAVDYMVGTFRGTFSPVDGKFEVAEDGTATLSGRTEAASVKVQDENLEAHLQTPDFFDAERTPELSFGADEIVRDGDDVTVRGELTIRGVEQPIELHGTIADPITDPYGRERIGLKLEGTVDRTSFEGKATGEAVRACTELGVPCTLFGGRVEDGVDAVALSGDPARAAVDLEELGARFGRS